MLNGENTDSQLPCSYAEYLCRYSQPSDEVHEILSASENEESELDLEDRFWVKVIHLVS